MHKVWKAWGVSVIGPGHRKSNTPNQDAWLFRNFRGGAALAVSDGLGSKPFSDQGSKAVCQAVIEAAHIFQQYPQADFRILSRLIHALWLLKVGQHNPVACAATCLFAIPFGENIILGRLGDGLICALGKSRSIILEDTKENSFTNTTNCLSDSFITKEWDIQKVSGEDCEAVILCTDGIADDIMPEKKEDFALSLLGQYKNMERKKRSREIAKWLSKWPVPGHSDDKTLACLYQKET